MKERILDECLGLWLADGCKTSKAEICFTNNEFCLIRLFKNTVKKYCKIKPYLYVYTPQKTSVQKIEGHNTRFYVDQRANKPYYTYKLYNTNFLKEWKTIVREYQNKKEYYPDILKGFFAGDGNVKYNPKCKSGIIRIAQGKQNKFLERMLNSMGFIYKYSPKERAYVISNFKNLKIAQKIKIANLHPLKRKAFNKMLKEYREEHYPELFLKKEVFKCLNTEQTSKDLSKRFNRTPARIYDVLGELKKEDKVLNFKIYKKEFWIKKNKQVVIISKIKNNIIKILKEPLTIQEIAKKRKGNPQSTKKRLLELQKLGIIKKHGKLWKKSKKRLKIIVK